MFIPLCLFQHSCFILKVFCVFTLITLPRLLITMMCCTCLSFTCPLVFPQFLCHCIVLFYFSLFSSPMWLDMLFSIFLKRVLDSLCFVEFCNLLLKGWTLHLDSKLQVCELCQSSADLNFLLSVCALPSTGVIEICVAQFCPLCRWKHPIIYLSKPNQDVCVTVTLT